MGDTFEQQQETKVAAAVWRHGMTTHNDRNINLDVDTRLNGRF